MIYPKNLKKNGTIGITALSAGIGDDMEMFNHAYDLLKSLGYRIVLTENVLSEKEISSSAKTRADQFESLLENPEIEAVMCASGGDFLMECLPYLDIKNIQKYPKWFTGYSDPSTILYLLPTMCGIASIYGQNFKSFAQHDLQPAQKVTLDFLEGNIYSQESYEYYQSDISADRYYPEYPFKVEWKSNKEFIATGRMLGGCIDALRDIVGTEFDKTKEFIEKYHEDGTIWAFDVFSLSSEDFYHTLFQMKLAGWFENAKAILLGRVQFPIVRTEVDYHQALIKIFGKDMPIIEECDIGHHNPRMSLILGAKATVTYKDGKGKIDFELK